MFSIFAKIFVVVFCFVEIFSISPALGASPVEPSIVVYPLQKEGDDDVAVKTADILRDLLKEKTPLEVIDPKKVESVLLYHKNYLLPSSEQSLSQAKEFLAKAKEHYFHFAYQAAGAEIEQAIKILEQDGTSLLERGQILLDSWLSLALVHLALNKKTEALKDFQKVLSIDPLHRLDESGYAPSVRRLFEEAKSKISKENSGRIQLTTAPKVADVFLNGIYKGVTPLTLADLPAGDYAIDFKANNYLPISRHLILKAGEAKHLKEKLFWLGSNPGKKSSAGRDQIAEGVRIANLLKTDKVLLVEADAKQISVRLIDRRYRASHRPLALKLKSNLENLDIELEQFVRLIYAQTELNLLKNPYAHLDFEGMEDPVLLGQERKKISKKWVWGGVGALGVGGLIAGILAANSSKPSPQASLSLTFK